MGSFLHLSNSTGNSCFIFTCLDVRSHTFPYHGAFQRVLFPTLVFQKTAHPLKVSVDFATNKREATAGAIWQAASSMFKPLPRSILPSTPGETDPGLAILQMGGPEAQQGHAAPPRRPAGPARRAPTAGPARGLGAGVDGAHFRERAAGGGGGGGVADLGISASPPGCSYSLPRLPVLPPLQTLASRIRGRPSLRLTRVTPSSKGTKLGTTPSCRDLPRSPSTRDTLSAPSPPPRNGEGGSDAQDEWRQRGLARNRICPLTWSRSLGQGGGFARAATSTEAERLWGREAGRGEEAMLLLIGRFRPTQPKVLHSRGVVASVHQA